MAINPEKILKYYRKCSNSFAANYTVFTSRCVVELWISVILWQFIDLYPKVSRERLGYNFDSWMDKKPHNKNTSADWISFLARVVGREFENNENQVHMFAIKRPSFDIFLMCMPNIFLKSTQDTPIITIIVTIIMHNQENETIFLERHHY